MKKDTSKKITNNNKTKFKKVTKTIVSTIIYIGLFFSLKQVYAETKTIDFSPVIVEQSEVNLSSYNQVPVNFSTPLPLNNIYEQDILNNKSKFSSPSLYEEVVPEMNVTGEKTFEWEETYAKIEKLTISSSGNLTIIPPNMKYAELKVTNLSTNKGKITIENSLDSRLSIADVSANSELSLLKIINSNWFFIEITGNSNGLAIATIELENSKVEFALDSSFEVLGTGVLTVENGINVNGNSQLRVSNSLNAKSIELKDNANLNLGGNGVLSVSESVKVGNKASLVVNNNLKTKNITLGEDTKLSIDSLGVLTVEAGIIVNGKSQLVINNILNTKDLFLDNSKLEILGAGKLSGLEKIDVKGTSSLNLQMDITAKNLFLNNSKLEILGAGKLSGLEKIDVKGTSSLNLQRDITAKNLFLDNSKFEILGTGKLSGLENIDVKGTSSLNLQRDIPTKNLFLDNSKFEILGAGKLSGLEKIDVKGASSLKDLNLYNNSNLEILGTGVLTVENGINVNENSQLRISNSLNAKSIELKDNASLSLGGNGVLNVETDINVNEKSQLIIDNILNTKSLNIGNNGNLSIGGNGVVNVKTDINVNGNSQLTVSNSLNTRSLELKDNTHLILGGNGVLTASEQVRLREESSLIINNDLKTNYIYLRGNTKLRVELLGVVNVETDVSVDGKSQLIIDNILNTKRLDIEKNGNLSIGGNGVLSVSDIMYMNNKSSLVINSDLKAKQIYLEGDTKLSIDSLGVVTVEGSIIVHGKSQLMINNILNTESLNIRRGGDLSIGSSGVLNINENLINIFEGGRLDLTITNSNMLKGLGINNSSAVLDIGSNQLDLKNYSGNINSQINLNILSDKNGKLNLSSNFQMIDGAFKLNIDEGVKNYKEGMTYALVNANEIILKGDNLFIFEDIKYTLSHQIVDGKILEVTLEKTDLVNPTEPNSCSSAGSDYCNIVTNLQYVIDNDLGNKDFYKDLSVFIADKNNREYNALQLKPISSTTKKEINSAIAGEFNNIVMDRIYNYNVKNRNPLRGTPSFGSRVLQRNYSANGSFWSSLGSSASTIKGASLGGLKEGSQGLQTYQGVVGLDYEVNEGDGGKLIGVAGGFGITSGKNKENISRFENNSISYSGVVYANYKKGSYYVSGNISYTGINNETTRYIDIPLKPKDNKATSTDMVMSVRNESGKTTAIWGNMTLNPFFSLGYTAYTLAGYEEEGSGFVLKLNDKNYNDIKVGTGLRLIGNIDYARKSFNPMFEVSYERKLNKDSIEGEMSFVNASSGIIKITEDVYSQDKIKLKAGLNYTINGSLNFGARIQQEFNKEVSNLGGAINISYNF